MSRTKTIGSLTTVYIVSRFFHLIIMLLLYSILQLANMISIISQASSTTTHFTFSYLLQSDYLWHDDEIIYVLQSSPWTLDSSQHQNTRPVYARNLSYRLYTLHVPMTFVFLPSCCSAWQHN